MGQKSVHAAHRSHEHRTGAYTGWGPVPRYDASGGLQSVLHGLAGTGILPGTWGQVQPSGSLVNVLNQLRGDETITTPYWQDPWIFASIYRLSEAAAGARLRLFRDRSPDAEPVGDDDLLYELFRRPHPALTYGRFIRHVTTLWWIYGEVPLALRRGPGRNWITEPGQVDLRALASANKRERLQIWPIKPDVAELLYDEEIVPATWRIRAKTQTTEHLVDIPAEAVAHLYVPDPMDVMLTRGMGRLEAVLRTLDIDWQAERFSEADVRTGGVPNIVVTAKGATEEQRKKLADDIEKKHQKPEKNGKALVLTGRDYDVEFPGHAAKEMAFVELRNMNRETKLAVMGVNPAWMGIIDDVNRANGAEGRRSVYEDTLSPWWETLAAELENELLPMLPEPYSQYGIQFDTSHLSALREDADKVAARAALYFETFPVTMEESFTLAGAELPEGIEGASERKPEPVAPEMPGEEKPPAKQSLAFDPGEHDIGRRAAWQVFHDQTMEHEGRVKKLALRVFGGYIDKAIALARDLAAEGKTFAWNGAVSHQIDENELHLLLPDIGPWQERMSDALMPALRDVLEQQARYIADAAGAEVLITRADPAALQFLTAKEIQIRETLPTLRAAIKSVLERALSDNATVGTLADQIRQALEMYRSDLKVMQDSLGSRAELIARTETTSVANGARMMEAERQGIVEMRWISSRDAFVRESHAALDGSVRPVGEVFGYGLKFPGDPDAPVGEIANCRCTVAPTARSAQAKGEAA